MDTFPNQNNPVYGVFLISPTQQFDALISLYWFKSQADNHSDSLNKIFQDMKSENKTKVKEITIN